MSIMRCTIKRYFELYFIKVLFPKTRKFTMKNPEFVIQNLLLMVTAVTSS